MQETIAQLVKAVSFATQAAQNEAQLRHELEKALEVACMRESVPWTPFQLERALRSGGTTKFADVAHGAVVIEYEPPKSLGTQVGAKTNHARQQAEEYAQLIAREEGRSLSTYILVVWDGESINFGKFSNAIAAWEALSPFNRHSAERLIDVLRQDGKPLVHPQLLQAWIGPDSPFGDVLIPKLYNAVVSAEASTSTTKTKLLFLEWKRLFSQVVGFEAGAIEKLLDRQEISHGHPYKGNPTGYLFALSTYIAIIAKFVAACALPDVGQDVLDTSVAVANRVRAVETGEIFENAGIVNMLTGDFFSWYVDDKSWMEFEEPLEGLLAKLANVDFEIAKKSPETTRDLFKGIYERFIPREVRHALGEFYTPDWLAEHGLNTLEWQADEPLTDPTCGTGTFLLEAIRRRKIKLGAQATAQTLLDGLNGIDLNPLAVLAAKGSVVVFLASLLDSNKPIRIPIYLADAINPSSEDLFGNYSHTLQTEVGPKFFSVPTNLIRTPSFFKLFARVRSLIDADVAAAEIGLVINREFHTLGLMASDWSVVQTTIEELVSLHAQGWNGIWCSILADRFAAGAVPRSPFVCGNPPWIRWSTLPTEYAKNIQQRCRELGVFSGDRWVGGIEADISTVVTFSVLERYLAPGGKLGFFLPESVFTTPSSAGFRRLSVLNGRIPCRAMLVEDFSDVRPFDGVSNHPTFLVVQRDAMPQFPIPYRVWKLAAGSGKGVQLFSDAQDFVTTAMVNEKLAAPVPGGDGRPWLVGSVADQKVFAQVFASSEAVYIARKGVTTDRNGIYWVEILSAGPAGTVRVRNAADIGKTKGIPTITSNIEDEHVFPLLRGRGVTPFSANVDPVLCIVLPQRGMHGDPELATTYPLTHKFLSKFKSHLEVRSSLKRYQRGQAYYSLWSTGAYTFSPFKVLWREMGKRFAAAYIGESTHPLLTSKVVIPDHKLYFIPVQSEDEAAFLTGFLNAPVISKAVAAYAAQLSLGASVAEYLNIPNYDSSDRRMLELSQLAMQITARGGNPTAMEMEALDQFAKGFL